MTFSEAKANIEPGSVVGYEFGEFTVQSTLQGIRIIHTPAGTDVSAFFDLDDLVFGMMKWEPFSEARSY